MAQGAAAARRLTIMAVTAALGALGMAGCGTDDAPPAPSSSTSSPAPTSASPTPTPTPTRAPTPPAKPAEWTQNDDAGALAAAQYFMDLYNYVIATGDLTEWNALAGGECQFCSNVAASVGEVYAAGGHYDGGALTTSDIHHVRIDQGTGSHVVTMRYSTLPMGRVGPDGTVESTTEAQSGLATFDLRPTDGGWALAVVSSRPGQS